MAIIQLNVWICEECGRTANTLGIVKALEAVPVTPPGGEEWGYVMVDGREKHLCPTCMVGVLMFNRIGGTNASDSGEHLDV